MPNIPLDRIKPNPFRDFELHPIDPAQVKRLSASIEADGFWASVVARKVGNDYQLAFGHHRLEAARAMQLETAPIEVRVLDDWQMVRLLAAENATQRGSTAAAALDAIAAVSRVLIYQCLRWDLEELRGVAKIFATLPQDAIESIWGKARKGEGPGERCLLDVLVDGTFTRSQLREAVGTIKDGGIMARIFTEARAQVDAEQAKAKSPPPKPASVPATRTPPPAPEVIFDANCARLFRLDSHLAEFRRIVTQETTRSYLPVDKQYEFAQAIIAKVGDHEMTAIRLREAANILLDEGTGTAQSQRRTSTKRPTDHRIKDGLNLLRRGTHDIKRGCAMLAVVLDDGTELSSAALARLDGLQDDITDALALLKPDARKRRGNLRVVNKGGK